MPHQCTACGRTFEDGSKEMLSGCPDCGGNKFQFKPAGAVDGNAGEGGGGVTSAATARKKAPENAEARSPGRDAPETEGDDRASAVDRAASTVRDWVSQRDDVGESPASDAEVTGAPTGPDPESSTGPDAEAPVEGPVPAGEDAGPTAEDSAQASARSDVVSDSELPDESRGAPAQADSTGETEVQARAEAGTETGAEAGAETGSEAETTGHADGTDPGLKELREELNSQFESIRIVEPGQYELNLMELYEREEYIVSLQEDGKYVIEVPDAWDDVER